MKKRVVVFTNYFLPGVLGGGPIRSVEGLVKNLSEYCDFDLVTSSHDAFKNEDYDNIKINRWNDLKYARCLYLSDNSLSIKYFFDLLKNKSWNYEIIYLNSFFNFWFSIVPIIIHKLFLKKNIKIILAPRGEFNPNALNNSVFKKKIFILFSKIFSMHKNIIWHASTSIEEEDIKKNFSNAKIKVVTNISLIKHQKKLVRKIKKIKQLKILFLSRITKMKNLIGALHILSIFKDVIEFNIYGPQENKEYYNDVISLIKRLPKNIKITINGPIAHEDISNIFDQNHVLLLPTFGENYGHVINESILNNCPVIISDKTPWQDLEFNNLGYVCDVTKYQEFQKKIKFFLEMDQNQYDNYVNDMYGNVSKVINTKNIISKYLDLFKIKSEKKS